MKLRLKSENKDERCQIKTQLLGWTILQFLFGIIVLFDELEAIESNITNQKITCTPQTTQTNKYNNNHDRIFCFTPSASEIVPITTLPLNATFPELITEIHVQVDNTNKSWVLNDHKMFHPYPNLESLVIVGNPFISSEYDYENMKKQLIDELFNLPKLASIRLRYWDHGDSYNWKFPQNISLLQFRQCNYTSFDLSSYSNLTSVDFSYGNLIPMPKFSSPSPPLQSLWMLGMPDMDFSVLDIVRLCSLKDIHMYDNKDIIRDTKSYCECLRLRNYTRQFHFVPQRTYFCDFDPGQKEFSKNCQDYPFEEAIRMHEKSCDLLHPPSTVKPYYWGSIYPTYAPRSSWRNRSIIMRPASKPAPCPQTSCAAYVVADIVLLLAILFIDVPLCLIFKMKILHRTMSTGVT